MLTRSLIVAVSLVLVGCTQDSTLATSPSQDAAVELAKRPTSAPESLVEDLVFLREEEKLARDVYITLYDAYGLQIFANISRAEQTHMDAVLGLLEARNIPDPVVDDAVGAFEDPFLAGLYTALVDIGMSSPLGALTVGATIEDLDIDDLAKILDGRVPADIARVCENLICGSRNHMRSFYGQIEAMGATYEAQYITQDDLEAIVSTSRERCGRRR